ncbi:MAG TPA: hypothetical protein VIX82_09660, partial [Solirubrobacteraceae bacterium]
PRHAQHRGDRVLHRPPLGRRRATTAAPIGQDLYFSAAAFVSASTPSEPSHSLGKVLQVVEAANGLGFLAIAIGYLPALFQAFSRRETYAISLSRQLALDLPGWLPRRTDKLARRERRERLMP